MGNAILRFLGYKTKEQQERYRRSLYRHISIFSAIKRRREELGLTQAELGQRFGGISKQAIHQWEKGDMKFTLKKLCRIAQALDTTPEYFLEPDDDWLELLKNPYIIETINDEMKRSNHA